MLTEAEKRQLADLESSLRETDPAFVERLAEGWGRPHGWRRFVSPLATAITLVTAGLGIGLAHLNLAVPSIAAIAVALVALGFAFFFDR